MPRARGETIAAFAPSEPDAGSDVAALQMGGGVGVVSGQPVESLYREIRALRICEGAIEVQQLIIARELLKDFAK